MTEHIQAIYEDGVFKPLEPLSLPEHQRVRISVTLEHMDMSDVPARQQESLDALDAEIAQLPDNSPDDDFTARDHDKVIYDVPP